MAKREFLGTFITIAPDNQNVLCSTESCPYHRIWTHSTGTEINNLAVGKKNRLPETTHISSCSASREGLKPTINRTGPTFGTCTTSPAN